MFAKEIISTEQLAARCLSSVAPPENCRPMQTQGRTDFQSDSRRELCNALLLAPGNKKIHFQVYLFYHPGRQNQPAAPVSTGVESKTHRARHSEFPERPCALVMAR